MIPDEAKRAEWIGMVERGEAFPAPVRPVGDGQYEWHLVNVAAAELRGFDVSNVCPPPSTWPEWLTTAAGAEAWHGWQRSRAL